MTFQVTIMFGLHFVHFLATFLNIVGLLVLREIDWNFVTVLRAEEEVIFCDLLINMRHSMRFESQIHS